jgi:hypothetical protein
MAVRPPDPQKAGNNTVRQLDHPREPSAPGLPVDNDSSKTNPDLTRDPQSAQLPHPTELPAEVDVQELDDEDQDWRRAGGGQSPDSQQKN